MEDRPPSDATLAERARNGDERAFEELVRTYQGIAFRTAYLLTGSAADAEDAAHVGFVKAWGALSRFRRGRGVQALAPPDRGERGAQSPALEHAASSCGCASGRGRASGGRGPVSGGGRARRRAASGAAGRREPLDERDRDVLACRYFLELSEEETAQVLGVRRGAR